MWVEGRAALAKKFNLCNLTALEDAANRKVFAGDGVVYLPAQSNDPSCTDPACDIASICAMLTASTGEPIDALADLSKLQWGGGSLG